MREDDESGRCIQNVAVAEKEAKRCRQNAERYKSGTKKKKCVCFFKENKKANNTQNIYTHTVNKLYRNNDQPIYRKVK